LVSRINSNAIVFLQKSNKFLCYKEIVRKRKVERDLVHRLLSQGKSCFSGSFEF
jgi:hypothetical protein